MERAQHTARLVLSDRQLPVQIIPELNEMFFGDWGMRHHCDFMQEDTEDCNAWCNDWQHAIPTNGGRFQAFSQRVEYFIVRLNEFQCYQSILAVSRQGVLSLLIVRLIGILAKAMWYFRVDQEYWSTTDISQKFATLRVLSSCAIGVENVQLFCFFTSKPQRPLADPSRLIFSAARLFLPDTTLQKLFYKNGDVVCGVEWDDSPLSKAGPVIIVPKSPLVRVY